jgi:hypothetical protein
MTICIAAASTTGPAGRALRKHAKIRGGDWRRLEEKRGDWRRLEEIRFSAKSSVRVDTLVVANVKYDEIGASRAALVF